MAASKPQAIAAGAWIGRVAQRPAWLLLLAVLAGLAPFITKPFHIDDPMFIWVAQHIQSHPANPYGFNVNWYGYDWPIWDITKNPPLACYYLSLAGGVLGWSEPALHAAFLLPAIAVILGTYRVARRLCERPMLAALVALFTPVFVVSGTTLMCDMLMLAFWVWAMALWPEGSERKDWRLFAGASVLMALASLTKYFGACAIPLVAAWSIAGKQPLKEWLGWLAIPVTVLIGYQLATRALYGHGLLADAAGYATVVRDSSFLLNLRSLVTGLAFMGGCLATVAFFAPVLWSRRELLIGSLVSVVVSAGLCFAVQHSFSIAPNATEMAQIIFWACGGISLLALAVVDVYQRRDAGSIMLGCWMIGTFVFAAFCNWVVNGRSILPMAIPAGILVARRFEQRIKSGTKFSPRAFVVPTFTGAALAMWVAATDYIFASAPQVAAEAVQARFGKGDHRLWFQGHWGFQYYMEKGGATALDLQHLTLAPGDYIAMPSHNSNVIPLKEPVTEVETISVPVLGWLTTMNKEAGAGFYASMWGPLPFAFGRIPEQNVTVYAFDPTGQLQNARPQGNTPR